MVDTQAFPFESTSNPKLWDGAYSLQERYSRTDVDEVVECARERGIRVMVEFDTPGHAASWCVGYPEICPNPPACSQPLDPSMEATFELIDRLIGEVSEERVDTQGNAIHAVSPENFIHLGGDEVDTACWEEDGAISKFSKFSARH